MASRFFPFFLGAVIFPLLFQCSKKPAPIPEFPKTNVRLPQILSQEQIWVRVHSVPTSSWQHQTNAQIKNLVSSNLLPFPEIEITNWVVLTNRDFVSNSYERPVTQVTRLATVLLSNRVTRTNWFTNTPRVDNYSFYPTPEGKKYEVTQYMRVVTNIPFSTQAVMVTEWAVQTNLSVETNARPVKTFNSNERRYTVTVQYLTNWMIHSNRVDGILAKTNWTVTTRITTNWSDMEIILPKSEISEASSSKLTFLAGLTFLLLLLSAWLGWKLFRKRGAIEVIATPYIERKTEARGEAKDFSEPVREVVLLPTKVAPSPKKSPAKKKVAKKSSPAKEKNHPELNRWDAAMSKIARNLPKKKYHI